MKIVFTISRILLGLILFIFGINGFVGFIPVPEFVPFMELMVNSGFIYVVKIIEVIAGILLLSNRFVPLALLLSGPVVVNIMLFHIFFDTRNWIAGLLNLLLYSVLLYQHRHLFIPFFKAKKE